MPFRLATPHDIAEIDKLQIKDENEYAPSPYVSFTTQDVSFISSVSSTSFLPFSRRISTPTLEERASNYTPRSDVLRPRYRTHTRYAEEVLFQAGLPRVVWMRQSLVGTTVMGLFDRAENQIETNPDNRYAGTTQGHILAHEYKHAENPDRHPCPKENERLNREATMAVTGDQTQIFGFYASPSATPQSANYFP